MNNELSATHDSKEPFYRVYFLTDGEYVKIGYARNVNSRINTLQTGMHRDLERLFTYPCYDKESAIKLEQYAHRLFSKHHINREWYDILKILKSENWKYRMDY